MSKSRWPSSVKLRSIRASSKVASVRARLEAYYPLDREAEQGLERCRLRHRAWEGQVLADTLDQHSAFTRAMRDGADSMELLELAGPIEARMKRDPALSTLSPTSTACSDR